ncbi:hypothetical protein C8A01DRAFT_40895 [Parachaetomium inaequale]|uniref:Uncharacterized protein n=1 Tax=Parachaetomium inaequale TaxID=2588326 RepID=A0AAN6P6N6_9PEZI|nr:hypothetical protein C8A01DRAFT_40895 [Parachaetomium inaequale]
MDELNDADTFAKTTHREYQEYIEKFWRPRLAVRYNRIREGYFSAIDTYMEDGMASMAELSASIQAEENEHRAERLCREMVFGRKALAQKLARDGIQHFRDKFGIDIPAVLNNVDNPIVIDSDADEVESNAGLDDDEEAADQDRAGGGSHSLSSPNSSQRKRTRNDRPNVLPPRRKRNRPNCLRPPDPVYDFSSVEAEDIRDSTGVRRIRAHDVEGQDFIFPYPAIGPGYFVVRCDRGKFRHQFQQDPLSLFRGRHIMVNHFNRKAPKPPCHERDEAKEYAAEELVRLFGYRVVDEEDNDVDSDWVERSNERLARTVDREKKKNKKNQAKGKQKAPMRPGRAPCSSRKGIPDHALPAWSSSRAVLAATESGAAGPSNTRGLVPVADMDPAGLWAAQQADVGDVNLGRQEEDGDMPPTRVESDIIPAE